MKFKSEGEIITYNYICWWLNNNYRISKSKVIINTRPKFLGGLELDFYIPRLGLAFEFQGEQHYSVGDKYTTNDSILVQRVFDDIQKDFICYKSKIILVRINTYDLQKFKFFYSRLFGTLFRYYGYNYMLDRKKHKYNSPPPKKVSPVHHLIWKSRYGYDQTDKIKDEVEVAGKRYYDNLFNLNPSSYGLRPMFDYKNNKNFSFAFLKISERIKAGEKTVFNFKIRTSAPLSQVLDYATHLYF